MKTDTRNIFGPLEPEQIYEVFYGPDGLSAVRKCHSNVGIGHTDWVRVGMNPPGGYLYITGACSEDLTVFPILKPS